MALSLGCDVLRVEASVIALHDRYNPGANVNQFQGVSLEDLFRVKMVFQVNINVFKLMNVGKKGVESKVVRRSLCRYSETMYLNLHENHFSYISDINDYCHSYRCRHVTLCGKRFFIYIGTNVPVKLLSNVCIREEYIILHNPSFNSWKKKVFMLTTNGVLSV